MRIGMLTSWNTQCGIAEYSRFLVKALKTTHPEHSIFVLGSRNYGSRDQHGPLCTPVFDIELWNENRHRELDVEKILELELDVLHVQYEVIFYNAQKLYELLERFQGLRVVTYHDNCIPPDFRYDLFDLRYSHRDDFGLGEGILLPMGVENLPPVIKTFGLGRSREDIIAQICLRNGWDFEKSFGEVSWKPQSELYTWLRDSDAVVLYYDDVPSAGTSIAARVALSTRRPVFVNDVTWFKDLQSDPPHLTKVANERELEDKLKELFTCLELDNNSWTNIARWTVADYEEYLEGKRAK